MSEEVAPEPVCPLAAPAPSATPEISSGATFENIIGKYTVTAVEDEKVTFDKEMPDGMVIKGVRLPIRVFRSIVSPATEAEQVKAARRAPTPVRSEPHNETKIPAAGVKPEEFSPEEIAEFQRLNKTYRGLSDEDRPYIVQRWDEEHGLDSPYHRLEYKRFAPERLRRRRTRMILALVPVLMFCWWLSNLLDRDSKRNDDSYVLHILRVGPHKSPHTWRSSKIALRLSYWQGW
jgi:hypothetical protein